MEFANQPAALIAWLKGQFVADDAPLGRPADYYAAIKETERLFNRMGVRP